MLDQLGGRDGDLFARQQILDLPLTGGEFAVASDHRCWESFADGVFQLVTQ